MRPCPPRDERPTFCQAHLRPIEVFTIAFIWMLRLVHQHFGHPENPPFRVVQFSFFTETEQTRQHPERNAFLDKKRCSKR